MTSTQSRVAPRPIPAPPLSRPPAPATLPERHPRVAGRWRYDRHSGEWWWSPEMRALYGLAAEGRGPCTEALVAAEHPDDRPRTIEALSAAVTGAQGFCLEVRLRAGDGEVPVVLLGEPQLDDDGRVTAVEGLAFRAPPPAEERVRALETEVAQLRTAMAGRAPIEQAKGVLMLLTGCGEQSAFDLLAHISSHTHRKVREVALDLVASAAGQRPLSAEVRTILRDACPPGHGGH
ncbi:ANTAR domain-containing protein [Geodermatophilus amargosae]|uniref:ANTAR domain-containing protein n=1 Tax=Geodermatophilus amargosae TaxID=1296565 RepID=UPI0034DE7CBF